MPVYKLIIPLGIIAYACLTLAVISGFLIFKYHVKWVKRKWHIWLGVISFLLATIHAVLVILFY